MTTFPGSPRLIKGTQVGVDPINPQANVILFRYTPEMMTRQLEARAVGGEGGCSWNLSLDAPMSWR